MTVTAVQAHVMTYTEYYLAGFYNKTKVSGVSVHNLGIANLGI